MLPLIALLAACSSLHEVPTGTEGPEPMPAAEQPDGSLRIATTPDREPARVAPVRDARTPTGEVIVRDCFGGRDLRLAHTRRDDAAEEGEAQQAFPQNGPPGMGGGGGAAAPASGARQRGSRSGSKPRPRPSPRPTPQAAPNPSPPPAAAAPVGGATQGDAGAAAPADAPGVALDDLSTKGSDGKAEKKPMSPPARKSLEQADDASGAKDRWANRGDEMDEVVEEMEPPETAKQLAKRVLDWGATVYLSNDDSMSLASAQRTLYSLKRKQRLSPGEVRPHELLNYFSFDVAPIANGQLFSVLGGAEQDGDTLSMSLAVRGASPERQPLDLTLVLDRSCSMSAEGRMEYTQRGLNTLADNLQDGDRVDMVLFDSGVCTPLENFVVGRDDPELLTLAIDQLRPTGSTDLDSGLREAYRIHGDRDEADKAKRNQRVVLLTDAMLNTGNVDEDLVSEVGRQFEDHDVRLTGIGVGRDFNDTMLNKLTEKGKGAYVYLGSEAVVDRVFGPGFDSLTRTIAHDVQFSLELPDSLAMERFYGEEASTVAADVQPIHYYAGTTQLFLQDLAIRDGEVVASDPIKMRIKYTDATTGEPAEEVLHTTVGALMDGDMHNLHKGQALMAFSDVAMAWAMRAEPCAEPLTTYRQRIASLTDDAEIAYTSSLLGDLCGVDMSEAVPAGVAYKVKVDSDMPIAEVQLACGSQRQTQALGGADTVARFDRVTPGQCTVQLQGTMPMTASVKVPQTGGDVRCVVRAGRLMCS